MDLNKDWQAFKLGELLFYEQPTKYIVESDLYNDNFDTPVLTAGKSFILGYTNETNNHYTQLPAIIFDDFTTESKFVDFKFKVKSSAMKILTTDSNKADLRFLFYLLNTLKIDSSQHKRYWISKYAELTVKVPALPTQKRIAEILDKADALRKKDQQLLKNYDDLAQSLFIDMFGDPVKNEKGWEKRPIKDVISFSKGLVDPREPRFAKMYHVGGDNIVSNTGELINLQITSSLNLISGKFLFDRSYILYNKIRPYLNKVAKPNFEGICSADMYPIKPSLQYTNRDYLWSVLTSEDFLKFTSSVPRRANIPKINREELGEYMIMLPPTTLQNQFAEQIQNIEQQKEKLKVQIEQSEHLFQALLQQAFNGNLD